jgi:L-lactate dehydrogenase complex protein LldF
LRQEVKRAEAREHPWNLEKLGFFAWAWVMQRPRLFELAGLAAQAMLPADRDGAWIRRLPGPLKAWTDTRDFPPPAAKSFRQLWRERRPRS